MMSNAVTGNEHWAHKGAVRLFLWEKYVGTPDGKPAALFVHGSSMASQPTFDLTVPDRPDSSVMTCFRRAASAGWAVAWGGSVGSDRCVTTIAALPTAATDPPARTDNIAK